LTKTIVFDSKTHLFAFNNKIFDLKQNQFTTPNPLDYISLTTGYEYDDYYDSKTHISTLKTFFKSVFSDPEVGKFDLCVLATGLEGINAEKIIVNSGSGGNGKGVTNELALAAVGNYGYKLPSSVLTQPLKQGGNPEVANLDNKRLVISQEPDVKGKNNKICTATVKELTGGSGLNARVLYSNKTSINLCLTLILECNKKLLLDDVTAADIRRVEEIPFEAKFVDQDTFDKLTEDERVGVSVGSLYYKSPEFKQQYKQAFFEILREHYAIYQKEGLKRPAKCEECKKKYLQKSDLLYSWITDNMEKSEDKNVCEKLKDVYERFRCSEDYTMMDKDEKKKFAKAKFIEDLESNVFLKRYIGLDKGNVKIIKNFKLKPVEDDD
jgi:phage/plasmid-associated DNA primase